MDDGDDAKAARQLGLLRFAIIGDLLAAPPERGTLTAALRVLAERTWSLPDHTPVRFGFSTIEGWYYSSRYAADPVATLTSRPRSDRGSRRVMDEQLLDELRKQYSLYPSWTVKLHWSNLAALVRRKYPDAYNKPPSYTTVRRTMRAQGWMRQRQLKTEGHRKAAERLAKREVRSFEATHAHSLWHFDFHECSRNVVDADGAWHKPQLLAFLDDRSRIICHAQWYLAEDTRRLVHGFCQAVLKRGLPRAVMHDNGSAMRAAEFQQGLEDLGVISKPILAYSPYQNGKKETFWAVVESQVIAMLNRVKRLDLRTLNHATQAWVEGSYHREKHEGIDMPPLDRLEASPNAVRPSPDMADLRFRFTMRRQRTQRRSDGTLSVAGVRFEIPSRLRALKKLMVRYRRWDLSEVWLVDPRTEDVLARIIPVDLTRNADGVRKPLEEPDPVPVLVGDDEDPFPPRLRELMEDYAADGLPPAYLPMDESEEDE
jgi:transposase InsO family protein